MAEWCINSVVFIAEPAQLTEIQTLFLQMAVKAQATGEGQPPHFILEHEGWFFDIVWKDNSLFYSTKWYPNTDHLIEVADYFCVDFRHHYAEVANGIYGLSVYTDGVLTITDLDSSDLASYVFDPETKLYKFEDKLYENSEDILDILIQRKIANNAIS